MKEKKCASIHHTLHTETSPSWSTKFFFIVYAIFLKKIDKLDKKAQLGVLVSNSEMTKSFNVYNIETQKLLVS